MNKKLMIGLIAGAAVIILGVGGFYLWGKASADVATKDFCNGLTKQADWNKCAKNVVILRGEMARLDATRFKKAWRNMYDLRNFVAPVAGTAPASTTTGTNTTGTNTTNSSCPAVMKTCPDNTTVGYDTTKTGCVFKECPVAAVIKPVLTNSGLNQPLWSGNDRVSVLTINGSGFGATQGTSTVKLGTSVLQVVSWSDTKVVCNISAFRLLINTYDVILTTGTGAITTTVSVVADPTPPQNY
jgi:hypothetical protein